MDLFRCAPNQIACPGKNWRAQYLACTDRTQERRKAFSTFSSTRAFISAASAVFAGRLLRRRYDLVHIHNMPDILVLSGLIPKASARRSFSTCTTRCPKLMGTILNRGESTLAVRLLLKLEKWSMARADSGDHY